MKALEHTMFLSFLETQRKKKRENVRVSEANLCVSVCSVCVSVRGVVWDGCWMYNRERRERKKK